MLSGCHGISVHELGRLMQVQLETKEGSGSRSYRWLHCTGEGVSFSVWCTAVVYGAVGTTQFPGGGMQTDQRVGT
jgi:hypothetical protein